jgi:palmitoyl-protein thioesterase
MGVSSIPGCETGAMCQYINYVAENLVYFSMAQNLIGPAGYYRDNSSVDNYSSYLADSVFLPTLNNERGDDATKATTKSKFASLDRAMLVMFDGDTVVHPQESEWFQQFVPGTTEVEPLKDSAFWIDDYIGLRALDEAGKVSFVSITGDHLQFSEEDIQNTFIPFLLA